MIRGFKARSERISARYRARLHVSLEEALPYRQLAEMLNIQIWEPTEIPNLNQAHVDQLTITGKDEWSAVTIEESGHRLIIVNPTHSEARLANDITHELAHLVLNHQKSHLEVSESGEMWLKAYRAEQEEEADWLAGALLLPRDGLISVYRRTRKSSEVAKVYGVSTQLARMRINLTGIAKQLTR